MGVPFIEIIKGGDMSGAISVLESETILRVANEGFLPKDLLLALCRIIGTNGRASKHFLDETRTTEPRVVDLILAPGCACSVFEAVKTFLQVNGIVATPVEVKKEKK